MGRARAMAVHCTVASLSGAGLRRQGWQLRAAAEHYCPVWCRPQRRGALDGAQGAGGGQTTSSVGQCGSGRGGGAVSTRTQGLHRQRAACPPLHLRPASWAFKTMAHLSATTHDTAFPLVSPQCLDYGVPEANIMGIRYGFRGFYDRKHKPVTLTRRWVCCLIAGVRVAWFVDPGRPWFLCAVLRATSSRPPPSMPRRTLSSFLRLCAAWLRRSTWRAAPSWAPRAACPTWPKSSSAWVSTAWGFCLSGWLVWPWCMPCWEHAALPRHCCCAC